MDAPQTNPMPANTPKSHTGALVGLAVIITLIVAGGGVYAWQYMAGQEKDGEIQRLTEQVSGLNSQVEQLQQEKDELNNQIPTFNYPYYFLIDKDQYVLHDQAGNKVGLTIKRPKESYYNDYPQKSYRYIDSHFSAFISPNREKIAFFEVKLREDVEDAPVEYSLYVSNVDGSDKKFLANTNSVYGHGDMWILYWQDDESFIYLDITGDESGTSYVIYQMNVNTGERVEVDLSTSYQNSLYNTILTSLNIFVDSKSYEVLLLEIGE